MAPDLVSVSLRTTKASLTCPRSDAEVRTATYEGSERDSDFSKVVCPKQRTILLTECEAIRAHILNRYPPPHVTDVSASCASLTNFSQPHYILLLM